MATRAQLDPVNRTFGIRSPGMPSSGLTVPSPRLLGVSVSAIPLWAVIGALVVVAAVLRFWSLTAWPVFSDEDSYVATAVTVADMSIVDQIMVATPRTFKAPMLVLLHANLTHVGVDPLLAGRVMSAVAGVVTTVLTWELGRRLGGRSVGLIAATLYAVSPMAILHERMINFDPWLGALALGTMLATVSAAERRSIPLALLAAALGALAVQAKTPGISVIAVPVVLLLFRRRDLPSPIREVGIAALGPVVSYLGLMQSPVGPLLTAQNAMLMAPFAQLGPNLADLTDSIWTYFPAGLALLLPVGAVLALRSSPRLALLALAMAGVWIAPWIVLSKFAPTRYDLPALPFLCAFAAVALHQLPRSLPTPGLRTAAALLMAGIVGVSALFSVRLVVDHENAPLSGLDDWQYRSGWPSGYGYGEAASLVRRVAEPGSSVAYAVDMYHIAGARLFEPLPAGVRSLGYIEEDEAVPTVEGRLYVIVDDGRDRRLVATDDRETDRLKVLRATRPDLEEIARFPHPRSELGVTVLRSR